MTLRDYVLAFARNWIVVAASVVVGLVTAGIVASATPPTYHASAHVLFTGHDPGGGQDQAYFGSYLQSRMSTYGKLVSSTRLMTAAAEKIGHGETSESLRLRTEIEVSERDTVAIIAVTDATAEDAARSANAVAEALLDDVARLEPEFTTGRPAADKPRSENATITGTISYKAVPPPSPISPNIPLYLLAGVLGGLVVGVGVIVYREVLRGDGPMSSNAEVE